MIKKIIIVLVFFSLITSISCKNSDDELEQITSNNGKYPEMTFDKKEHDFGNLVEGDKVETVFSFKNTGQSDLIISNAVGSCGCTVPEYPKENIAPGESSQIVVSFNSAGKNGKQMKTVTLTTNTLEGKEILTITSLINSKSGKRSGIISY